MKRNWRDNNPDQSIDENIEDAVIIAKIETATKNDPPQKIWKKLAHPAPTEPIPIMSNETSGIAALKSWRTSDGTAIPFPKGEDEEIEALVRSKNLIALAHSGVGRSRWNGNPRRDGTA
ncbi:hypothetical protein E4U60_006516 [Claviceps pazoutovae]|uniref:Uncharacterized protein n=1 Tax=Claviceps pazoutovae TaxID=1649127 RepID=A0A9P7M6S2_9HYPO|nr:hypothetical protein E4U60_006516 [Claviceps pazoutovae]